MIDLLERLMSKTYLPYDPDQRLPLPPRLPPKWWSCLGQTGPVSGPVVGLVAGGRPAGCAAEILGMWCR